MLSFPTMLKHDSYIEFMQWPCDQNNSPLNRFENAFWSLSRKIPVWHDCTLALACSIGMYDNKELIL